MPMFKMKTLPIELYGFGSVNGNMTRTKMVFLEVSIFGKDCKSQGQSVPGFLLWALCGSRKMPNA
ncbi:hypothetical protein CFAM422_009958 [Trichoderma lentiforme]|uniref:Uncharacterized protein n=1 Tax=Trichoderma lentiforme TaxID=1567552 RepID=A0A9P4X6M8_9HYPO|nr:hypothetical protein CFAM422_009958 [Trichoderma lentiforme]